MLHFSMTQPGIHFNFVNRSDDAQTKTQLIIAPHKAKENQGTVSPLTPALSPLRGEGARRPVALIRKSISAIAASLSYRHENSEAKRTRNRLTKLRGASDLAPSPLNGERAGVRGENGLTPSNAQDLSPDSQSL